MRNDWALLFARKNVWRSRIVSKRSTNFYFNYYYFIIWVNGAKHAHIVSDRTKNLATRLVFGHCDCCCLAESNIWLLFLHPLFVPCRRHNHFYFPTSKNQFRWHRTKSFQSNMHGMQTAHGGGPTILLIWRQCINRWSMCSHFRFIDGVDIASARISYDTWTWFHNPNDPWNCVVSTLCCNACCHGFLARTCILS